MKSDGGEASGESACLANVLAEAVDVARSIRPGQTLSLGHCK